MSEDTDEVGPDETTWYELWDRDSGNMIMDWEVKDRSDLLAFIAGEVDGLSPEEAERRADHWALLRFFGMTSYETLAEGAAVLKLRELK